MEPATLSEPTSRAGQVTEVVLDGSALLRIVKHCEDNLPGASTGALLGLDVAREDGGTGLAMHVTYAFALPRGRGEDMEEEGGSAGGGHQGDDEAARADYRRHMMKLLKEVGGWVGAKVLALPCCRWRAIQHEHGGRSLEETHTINHPLTTRR